MARKNIARKKLVDTQSLAASFQSSVVNCDYLDNVGIIITTSGVTDNLGTFGIQVREITGDSTGQQSSWSDLDLSAIPTLADADANMNIFLYNLPFSEFRVTFTAIGGTPDGTCDIWVGVKQIGG